MREWRAEFARRLRELGVPANATERAVRGETRTYKRDGIYRAMLRGDSTHMRERVEQVVRERSSGKVIVEAEKEKLFATRRNVEGGWQAVRDLLAERGSRVVMLLDNYLRTMPPAKTERENVARKMQYKSDVQVKTKSSTSR